MSPFRPRSGFALVLAVCLLATIGSLAGASFFATREAQRAATRLARQEEAATAADARVFDLIDAWVAPERDSLRVGATDTSLAADTGLRGVDSYVTRVTEDIYSVTAVGRAGQATAAEARRVHRLLVRLVRPTLAPQAAVVSRGDVVTSTDATVSGHDTPPPGWADCPPPDSATAPSVLIPEGRTARDRDGHPLPDARVDSLADALATYGSFGPATVAFLAGRADVAVQAGAMVSPRPAPGDKCGPGQDITNWGEPSRGVESPRCQRYFPIIHADGDIVVTSGRGQGLLLVDGRLRIEGPFVFSGVILAAGGVETSGSSVNVYGSVLSAAVSAVGWGSAGGVQRSTCAVSRALAAASRPVPVGRRGWSELF